MGAESHRDLLRALGAALALLAVAVLATCGAGSGPQPAGDPGARGGTDTQATPEHPRSSSRRRARDPTPGRPTAEMGGKLVLDERGCLRVRPRRGPDWIPVWPANLDLETGHGNMRVTNKEGRTVAEVGEKVVVGGGQIGLPRNLVDPRTAREPRARCPGNYWIAPRTPRQVSGSREAEVRPVRRQGRPVVRLWALLAFLAYGKRRQVKVSA